jgi:NAD(P)-dependent dehydrogenase (short-subunit alcohol dehydrogenase family)
VAASTRFRDRVAVVTGAADGIRAATAEGLAREGAHVAVTGIQDEDGAKAAARMNDSGGRASCWHLDVASGADWDAPADHVGRIWGRLDVLHSNAGRAIVVTPAQSRGHRW